VLSHLVANGWIETRRDPDDQRARLLVLTEKGHDLAVRLADLQVARVHAALTRAVPGKHLDEAEVRRFLFAMIAAEDQPGVQALLQTASNSRTCAAAGARPQR
jgi:DNA-binding MarR family transcriptional regulator